MSNEPVAWMHVQGSFEEPSLRQLDEDEIGRGWKQYPLYTNPAPDDTALKEWIEKTEWVQKTAQPRELGMHRADVIRQRVERDTALRRRVIELLEPIANNTTDNPRGKAHEAITALRERLGEKK